MKTKNRKFNRIIIALLLTLPLLTGATPYPSYYYDQFGVVPILDAAVPTYSITGSDLGTTALSKPNDFRFGLDGLCYIADTGNDRILVLDESLSLIRIIETFDNNGAEDSFSSPEGVFAEADGKLFIADTQNERIVVLDAQGNLITLMDNVSLTGSALTFRPQKVVVDTAGRIYAVSSGSTEGLVQLTPEGSFVRFFGSNRVNPNPAEVIYRMFLTRQQRQAREQFIPTEFSNLYIDEMGFLYVTTRNVKMNQIKRLNAVGNDVLKHEGTGENTYGDLTLSQQNYNRTAQFQAVATDKDENVFALDNATGKIFVYDNYGQFLFMFGGKGNQTGMFTDPQAIAERDGTIYVCDSGRGAITVFNLTDFGQQILNANHLYLLGEYEESIEPWNEVVRMDAGYTLAWHALGQAYYGRKDYAKAMEYYKLGFSQSGYSRAFGQIRDMWIRDNFAAIVLIIIVILISVVVLSKTVFRRKKKIPEGEKAV
ncbi:MAG: hypothetical protein LBS21_09675 [Clostridiales bacterium]|jgi:DNA-binding beta-propeller fold protein YncE|nr:hypothetical protein [Clostridiales bacterium]